MPMALSLFCPEKKKQKEEGRYDADAMFLNREVTMQNDNLFLLLSNYNDVLRQEPRTHGSP